MDIKVKKGIQVIVFVFVVWLVWNVLEYLFYSAISLTKMM